VNTTVLEPAPAPEVTVGVGAGRQRAVLALARVEAVRLLRHPITLAAVLFLVGIWVSGWLTNEANRYPVLQDADRDTQLGTMLLLGGAALIASNLAVLRAHRNGTTALSDVLVLPRPQRTAAHLLALLPLALLAAALTVARIGVLAMAPAAGRPNPFELATGPVIVLLFGAIGVLFGRLTRSPIAAPLALLAVLALLFVLPLFTRGGPARWLQPVVPEGDAAFALPMPVHLMARPAGPHLAYLAGLTALVVAAALARSGTRTIRVVMVAVVASAVTVAGAIAQFAPPSQSMLDARVVAVQRPASQQTCQHLGQVTYCAFPDFAAWIPGWDAEVRAVLRLVPAATAQRPLAIRQRISTMDTDGAVPAPPLEAWRADDLAAGTPNAVTVGTRWGDTRSATRLAGLVAFQVVAGVGPGTDPTVCGARAVVVAWLVGQASAASNTGLHQLTVDQHDKGVFLDATQAGAGIFLPDRELTMGLALLDRPASEVAARVTQSWDELTTVDTTTERAAELLGVPTPPAAPGQSTPPGPKERGTTSVGQAERGPCA
jgi:hypothetical protein